MNKFMTENPQHLTEDNMEGVYRVKTNTHYAFLMESTSIEYNTKRECNLKKIGDALDEKGYGIAMRKSKLSIFKKFNITFLSGYSYRLAASRQV